MEGWPLDSAAETGSEAQMTIIDLSVSDALQRLRGIRKLIEHLDESIPDKHFRDHQALDELATQERWDYAQFQAENQVLDADYLDSIPRYATYSVILILWSFIETQLVTCAERVGHEKATLFRVRDLKGPTLKAASTFLQRVSAIRIEADPGLEVPGRHAHSPQCHRTPRWPEWRSSLDIKKSMSAC